MQALTANEIAILKSRFQAGTSGHQQQVVLSTQVSLGTLRSPYYVSATLMPNKLPALLFRAIDTPYTAGTEKVYFARYRTENYLEPPILLFSFKSAILSITTYLTLVVAVAYEVATTKIW